MLIQIYKHFLIIFNKICFYGFGDLILGMENLTTLQKAVLEKAQKSRDLLPKRKILALVNEHLKKPVSAARVSQCLSGYQFDADIAEAVIKAGIAYDNRLMEMAQ